MSQKERQERKQKLSDWNNRRTKQQCSDFAKKGWITRRANLAKENC